MLRTARRIRKATTCLVNARRTPQRLARIQLEDCPLFHSTACKPTLGTASPTQRMFRRNPANRGCDICQKRNFDRIDLNLLERYYLFLPTVVPNVYVLQMCFINKDYHSNIRFQMSCVSFCCLKETGSGPDGVWLT